jgi:hypothetical protein
MIEPINPQAEKERQQAALLKLKHRKTSVSNDIIKIYPERRDENGLLMCPFCDKSDCLRKMQHEWYCANTKQYFNFTSRGWL